MCLTLANAALVLEHRDGPALSRSYTLTSHHAGRLEPGDLFRPDPDGRPRTVTKIRRHDDRIVLTDQLGQCHEYRSDAVIPTAVADPLRQASRASLSR